MTRAIYEALLQGLSERFSIDPAALLANGFLAIDGVHFEMRYCESELEDFVLVLCNFGPVASGPFAKSVSKLLELNLYLADSDVSSFFASDPGTADVLLCIRMMVYDLSFELLSDALVAASQQALAWRRGELGMIAKA